MGYRLWNLITKKLFRSRDVVFHEDQTVSDFDKTILKDAYHLTYDSSPRQEESTEATNGVHEAANDVQEVANSVQEASNDVQEAANDIQEAMNDVQEAANDVQEAANGVQEAANDWKFLLLLPRGRRHYSNITKAFRHKTLVATAFF
ncbi:hypothetical protein ACLB2K_017631 [Fragaria x ananassa]